MSIKDLFLKKQVRRSEIEIITLSSLFLSRFVQYELKLLIINKYILINTFMFYPLESIL